MDYTVYLVVAPIMGALLILLLAMLRLTDWQRETGTISLFALSALGFLVATYLELIVPALSLKVLFARFEDLFISLIPITWLVFVFQFTGRTDWTRFRRFWPLCLPGAAQTGLVFTNNLHHLLWQQVLFVPAGAYTSVRMVHGILYPVVMAAEYSLMAAGLYLLWREFRHSFGVYRRQLLWLVLGALVPLAFNLVYITQVIPHVRQDFTAVGFGFSALFSTIGIRRARFLELMPVPRSLLFDVLEDGLVVVDGRQRIIDINRAAMSLLALDETSLGRELRELPAMAGLLSRWDGLSSGAQSEVAVRIGGRERHYELRLKRSGRSGPRGAIAIIGIHDITERVGLRTKDVLLREIHHRVKNNLQLISSLLFLEQSRVVDSRANAALRQCRNQILSMALIHEDLYRSEDFHSTNFAEYARTLTGRILSSLSSAGRVDTEFDLDEVSLDIERAIPCGLILNELCTNALKHAFPEGFRERRPRLRIGLHESAGVIRLTVSDNGVGMPLASGSPVSGSLGTQIVLTLAKQLHAEIDFRVDVGTTVALAFRADEDGPPEAVGAVPLAMAGSEGEEQD